ncbi:hypothetical protein [Thalassotalea litorea]|uniref:hypothetical protein n=1 Tax=Thalassotalea litorea TaxID=2020715 RepID=UPI003735F6EA
MMFNKKGFYAIWKVGFKLIFLAMLFVLGLRLCLLYMYGKADSVTISSVLLGLAIAAAGTALITGFIAWVVVVNDKSNTSE